ncbi:hypothetical protein [Aliikangiella sp. G2MR2-5]|uniref:hypothetical protein n=1 Tax=Aliikangiella sp. G2MR2-5 TaxID=2788943 RepID=UPI001AED994B|nr:hypothetical protein [Aliikangiella sp. G2MR2-5]
MATIRITKKTIMEKTILKKTINTVVHSTAAGCIALAISACCFTKKNEVSFQPVRYTNFHPANKLSPEYPDHFLGCRVEVGGEQSADKARVDRIINKLKQSRQDVVLYFHGGLSGQDYMIDTLGKKLMQSMFEQASVKQKLYPIFLGYDAHPKDTLPDILSGKLPDIKVDNPEQAGWDYFKAQNKALMESAVYQALQEAFREEFGYNALISKSIESRELDWQSGAVNMIFESLNMSERKSRGDYELTDNERELLEDILAAEELPDSFIEADANKIASTSVDRLGQALQAVTSEASTEKEAFKSLNNKLQVELSKLRILRILARFALRVDHGFFATIQEEVLDEVGLGKVGKAHWDVVKLHAKQCFDEKRLGRYLIDELIKLKQSRDININTLSHSAGSIPTVELIKYLGEGESSGENRKGILSKVVMLVPAVNQAVFSKFVIPNEQAFDELKIYSLDKRSERSDKVVHDLLYSSSLLYAVSSLGERSPSLDNMMLIDQHMRPNAFPYDKKTYRCIAGEKPKALWQWVKPGQANSLFVTYPFAGEPKPPEGAASHEGTKYPWLSGDLSRKYLKDFGVKGAEGLKFEEL